jgi:outer membrane protein OmpU
MNILKKIGLSALAGSLAATSAFAGELTVNGTANLTYTSTDNQSTNNDGNRIGSETEMSFTGSGDVNGMTVSYYTALNNTATGIVSHNIGIDMGDLGKIEFDQGVGGNGLTAIDDKTPTANEEAWDGFGTTALVGVAGTGSTNVLQYTNTVAGFGINFALDKEIDDADTTEGATSRGTTALAGSNYSFALTNATLVDGLDFGVGYSETDIKDGRTTSNDGESWAAYANYSVGPVTVGYTRGETSGVDSVAGADMHLMEAYGIAFAVNENLSVSYGAHDVEVDLAAGDSTTQEATSVALAYTMGGASVTVQNSSMDNKAGDSSAQDEERTEISLKLAF